MPSCLCGQCLADCTISSGRPLVCVFKDRSKMGMMLHPSSLCTSSQKQEDGYNLATNLAHIARCRLAEAT